MGFDQNYDLAGIAQRGTFTPGQSTIVTVDNGLFMVAGTPVFWNVFLEAGHTFLMANPTIQDFTDHNMTVREFLDPTTA